MSKPTIVISFLCVCIVFSYYCLTSLLNSCSVCIAGTHIFENAAKVFRFKQRVFVIRNYYAMTSYKHVKERLEASFKRHDCIEVQDRHFELL